MAVSVEVPNLGETMAGGLVAEWYRADGARVRPGEVVCRVESSYVAFEVEAQSEGTLRHRKPAGSIEGPGSVLGLILAAEESMPGEGGDTEEPWKAESDDELGRGPAATANELAGGMALRHSAETETMVHRDFMDVEAETSTAREPGAPPEDLSDGIRESVVVPFPGRFIEPPRTGWEAAPADAAGFDLALWDEPAEGQTEELPEPGGSIPGLPLWEQDEGRAADSPANPATERVGEMGSTALGDAQVMHATILTDAGEALRLTAVCEREWRDSPRAEIEDVMFRAIAFALREQSGADATGGMLVAETNSDVVSGLTAPASVLFRDAVVRRHSGGDAAFEGASWQLVSVTRHGVYSCTPRLDQGRKLAFAMGAADTTGRATLTMAFDTLEWSEGSAARLLARIRELFESPCAMLI